MKKAQFPVLLVALTLLCVFPFQDAAAQTGDDDAIRVPGVHRSGDLTVDTSGTDSGDGSEGDPDTVGDGLQQRRLNDLLGNIGTDGYDGAEDRLWIEMMLFLQSCFPIVR